MKILVHDSGHAFPLQLSRHLATRGHDVLHLYAESMSMPRGPVAPRPDDPPNFHVQGLSIGKKIDKYSYIKRSYQERAYGKLLASVITRANPDVVLGGTSALDIQGAALVACRRRRIGFVFWAQDITSIAIDRVMRRKIPVLGAVVGAYYKATEKLLLNKSDEVIAISDDFARIFESWGVARQRISVIENWAPRDELPPRPRDNDWARAHDLAGKFVFLYAGTLGLKHNPALLLHLAQRFADRPEVRVVVASEGPGAEFLAGHQAATPNLVLLPYQPFETLPDMMGAADVLVTVLEPDAGVFSAPSKVLTYLCAGRPILGVLPEDNLATRVIARARAGITVAPDDEPEFLAAAERLLGDTAGRVVYGQNALDYAAKTFDIRAIGDRFEPILARAARRQ